MNVVLFALQAVSVAGLVLLGALAVLLSLVAIYMMAGRDSIEQHRRLPVRTGRNQTVDRRSAELQPSRATRAPPLSAAHIPLDDQFPDRPQ